MLRVVCWLVLVIFSISTVADLLADLPTAGAPSHAVSTTDLAAHSNCRCKACAGGASCCCRHAATPVQSASMRAACDTGRQSTLARKLTPCTLPRVASLPLMAVEVRLVVAEPNSRLRSRLALPLENPPRFL